MCVPLRPVDLALNDENYWHTVEGYIGTHTSTKFSHGICPECLATRVESL